MRNRVCSVHGSAKLDSNPSLVLELIAANNYNDALCLRSVSDHPITSSIIVNNTKRPVLMFPHERSPELVPSSPVSRRRVPSSNTFVLVFSVIARLTSAAVAH